jgi:hypothetical protein
VLATGASSGARIEARQGPPLVLCSTQNQEASSKLARGWRPAAVCVRCSLMRCTIAGGWGGAGRWRLAGLVVVRFVWWGSASDVGHQAVAGWEKPIGVWTVASGSLPGRKAMTWVMSSGIWRWHGTRRSSMWRHRSRGRGARNRTEEDNGWDGE